MTSKIYSANKHSSRYDFGRSIISVISPSVVSLIASFVYFVYKNIQTINYYYDGSNYAVSKVEQVRKYLACVLTNTDYYGSFDNSVFPIIGVIIGVLFALFAFAFMNKKNRVNVYFSFGVDRRTLFKNRVLASMLMMALTSVVPIGIDVAINIHYFDHVEYMVSNGIALFATYYADMLAGFALMAIAMCLCNTIIESLFFGGLIICLPTIVDACVSSLCENFLRGYYYSSNFFTNTSIINPLLFNFASDSDGNKMTIFSFLLRGVSENSSLETDNLYNRFGGYGYKALSKEFIIPIIVWLVIAGLFIFVAERLLLARKLENAGMHGSVPFASQAFAITAIIAGGTALFCIIHQAIYYNFVDGYLALYLLIIPAMIIAYYILLSIEKRKIKHSKKTIIAPVASIIILTVAVCLLNSGLGYGSYTPDIDKIEYATINFNLADNTGGTVIYDNSSRDIGYDYINNIGFNGNLAVFTDKEDLEKLESLHKNVAKSSGYYADATITYVLKNGKSVTRSFNKIDYDAYVELLSLTDTNAYHEQLEYLLSSKQAELTDGLKILSSDEAYENYFMYNLDLDYLKDLYQNGEAQIRLNDLTTSEIKNTAKLKDALLADLLNTDYKEKYFSDEKPICAIEFYNLGYEPQESDFDDIDDYYNALEDYNNYAYENIVRFYIYDSFENVINYLKSSGEYSIVSNYKDAMPNAVYVCKAEDMQMQYDDNRFFVFSSLTTTESNLKEYEDDYYYDDSSYGLYYMLETDKITDADKINELIDKSNVYKISSTDDYMLLLEYEDYYLTRIISSKDIPSYVK